MTTRYPLVVVGTVVLLPMVSGVAGAGPAPASAPVQVSPQQPVPVVLQRGNHAGRHDLPRHRGRADPRGEPAPPGGVIAGWQQDRWATVARTARWWPSPTTVACRRCSCPERRRSPGPFRRSVVWQDACATGWARDQIAFARSHRRRPQLADSVPGDQLPCTARRRSTRRSGCSGARHCCALLHARPDPPDQGDDGDHDQHHDAPAKSSKSGSKSNARVLLLMATTPRPRSGYSRMTFQKPAPAPKCSTQSPWPPVGRRNQPVP